MGKGKGSQRTTRVKDKRKTTSPISVLVAVDLGIGGATVLIK